MANVNFDFDKYPTILKMVQDDSFIRFVIGPRGSAKTSGIIAYLLAVALMQRPGKDGVRRVKTGILRQSYQQLVKSTTTSIKNIVGDIMVVTDGKPPTGSCTIPLEDGTILEWKLVFYAGEAPNVKDDVLGAELTNLFVDEISSLVSEELVLSFLACIGRYPSPVLGDRNMDICFAIGATNGPTKAHWLYKWHMGQRNDLFKQLSEATGKNYFKLFKQPAGLLRQVDGTYIPNPAAENVDNLPGGFGYYYNMLTRKDAEIVAYVEGDFADLSSGKVVYPQFKRSLHSMPHQEFLAMWGKQGKINMGFDFGRTPAALCWIDRPGGGIIIFEELAAEDISIDGFYTNVLRPTLMEKYPLCTIGMPGSVTGDPAGADRSQAVDLSPYEVLQKNNINIEFPGDSRQDTLEPRIEAVRQRLTRLDALAGHPMIMVTDNCPLLLEALTSTYVYKPVKGNVESYAEVPTKSHANWVSEFGNIVEYICLYRRANIEPAAPRGPKNPTPALLGG